MVAAAAMVVAGMAAVVAAGAAAGTWGAAGRISAEVALALAEERPTTAALAWVAWVERVTVVTAAGPWRLHAALGE